MGAASTAKDNKRPQGRRAAWRMGEKGASVILLLLNWDILLNLGSLFVHVSYLLTIRYSNKSQEVYHGFLVKYTTENF